MNNTTQTPPFSHEIESFVDIFKWNIVSNEFVNLNFLQAKIVKNYYIVRQQIYQSEFPTGRNWEYKLQGYSTIWLFKLETQTRARMQWKYLTLQF